MFVFLIIQIIFLIIIISLLYFSNNECIKKYLCDNYFYIYLSLISLIILNTVLIYINKNNILGGQHKEGYEDTSNTIICQNALYHYKNEKVRLKNEISLLKNKLNNNDFNISDELNSLNKELNDKIKELTFVQNHIKNLNIQCGSSLKNKIKRIFNIKTKDDSEIYNKDFQNIVTKESNDESILYFDWQDNKINNNSLDEKN